MKLTKNGWMNLTEVLDIQNNGIRNKSASLGFNPEVSAKNGGTETLLGMITEMESTLRVLKRKLQETVGVREEIVSTNGAITTRVTPIKYSGNLMTHGDDTDSPIK